MIPANIDHVTIVRELNEMGWRDAKIELVCGFSQGYVLHIKAGHVQQMNYQRAARLYNLWFEEVQRAAQKLASVQQATATT